MSGLFFTALVAGLIAIGLAVAFVIWRSIRTARALRDRCIAELRQLKALVASRHLILSHLADSLPSNLDPVFERQRLNRRRKSAEQAMESIDFTSVEPAELRNFGDAEQRLLETVETLKRALEESDSVGRTQSVIGCIEGLEKADAEILDSVSTYNAAAITYAGFIDSSLIARRYFRCSFTLLDLDPQASCISTNRVAS